MKAFILEADYPSFTAAKAGLDRLLRYGVTNHDERPEIFSYGNSEIRLYAIRCYITTKSILTVGVHS